LINIIAIDQAFSTAPKFTIDELSKENSQAGTVCKNIHWLVATNEDCIVSWIGCNKYSGEIGMCTSVNRGAVLNTGCFLALTPS